MTRGRRKDITIPPTRALTLQRDYRARKTQYVLDLELRCRTAEEENARLKQEVAFLRQQNGQPVTLSLSVIQASAQLRDILAAASTSVSHFMQIALPADGAHSVTPSQGAPSDWQPDTVSVDSDNSPNSTPDSAIPPRPESPCCSGWIDCDALAKDQGNYLNSEGVVGQRFEAISQIRSTSEVVRRMNFCVGREVP
ncbi:hypothetical protein B0H16DRAFT_1333851 [Mycena metata]|uniref:BZIP domain-containing protein n=1 Tax=Mycena metata TaxID=1033252 RepID=A0AAD7MMN7_9AGAR|nr:hypothetical protein B0H16DRAFT_1333851 [Mycena metata]